MAEPTLAAGAVATRSNDLLVVRSSRPEPRSGPGDLSIPSVSVRSGETMVEAVVRAVGEQAGLDALCGPFMGWFESLVGGAGHQVTLCFAAVVLDDTTPAAPAGDVAEAMWMPVWDVAELPLADGLAELLAEHGVIDTLT